MDLVYLVNFTLSRLAAFFTILLSLSSPAPPFMWRFYSPRTTSQFVPSCHSKTFEVRYNLSVRKGYTIKITQNNQSIRGLVVLCFFSKYLFRFYQPLLGGIHIIEPDSFRAGKPGKIIQKHTADSRHTDHSRLTNELLGIGDPFREQVISF